MEEYVFDLDEIVEITGIDPRDPGKVSIQSAVKQLFHNNMCRSVLPNVEAEVGLASDQLKLFALSQIQTR